MPALSNSKHELFVQGIASGLSQVAAYKSAGYNANDRAASVAATRLLATPKIKARLEEVLQRRARASVIALDKSALTKQWVIEKLMKNAMIALGEEKIKVTRQDKDTGAQIEVEIVDRDASAANKALELLGKTLALFVERQEVGGPGDFDKMSTDELERYIRDEASALGIGLEGAATQAASREMRAKLN